MKARVTTRVKARRKPISSIIGQVDGFLLCMELPNYKYGPKNLHWIVSIWSDEVLDVGNTSSFTWQR
jgi:hypothetical protein